MSVNTTRYDRYGRPAGYINPIEGAPEPYKIKQASATTTYTCFYETGSDPRAIRRDVQLEDEAQACVGWGAWDNAENIDYYPINSVFTVDSETKALVSVSPYNTPVAPLS